MYGPPCHSNSGLLNVTFSHCPIPLEWIRSILVAWYNRLRQETDTSTGFDLLAAKRKIWQSHSVPKQKTKSLWNSLLLKLRALDLNEKRKPWKVKDGVLVENQESSHVSCKHTQIDAKLEVESSADWHNWSLGRMKLGGPGFCMRGFLLLLFLNYKQLLSLFRLRDEMQGSQEACVLPTLNFFKPHIDWGRYLICLQTKRRNK